MFFLSQPKARSKRGGSPYRRRSNPASRSRSGSQRAQAGRSSPTSRHALFYYLLNYHLLFHPRRHMDILYILYSSTPTRSLPYPSPHICLLLADTSPPVLFPLAPVQQCSLSLRPTHLPMDRSFLPFPALLSPTPPHSAVSIASPSLRSATSYTPMRHTNSQILPDDPAASFALPTDISEPPHAQFCHHKKH